MKMKKVFKIDKHQHIKSGIYKTYFKRPLDVILALMAIILLSPALLVIAILIRVKLGSPVIFKQTRPGLNERIFTLYKFRTMTDEKDEYGKLLSDEIRLTKFGKFIRSTSLDELPELFNILKGDMSFVGPRPQLVRDMVFMTPNQRMRHVILPGLTGWAQVNGRNSVTWERKLSLDIEYLENITFIGDIKIILMTVTKVFKRDGISADGMNTAEDFGDYLLRENKVTYNEYLKAMEESSEISGKKSYEL
ncbi:sugar transferase [Bacillus sp. Marseille-P3661]|uniref:sugar transferase n=1 Tax=Bacillus sp. Marseille-P3661 TaxID=1936234 RepID=UPI0027E4C1A5|nr:sugar transferase [Bacillus sp. Marseille-P3661]